jgi:hypothetical protein
MLPTGEAWFLKSAVLRNIEISYVCYENLDYHRSDN